MTEHMPSAQLLTELSHRSHSFSTYRELEDALTALMTELGDAVSAHVSAADVLDYGARHKFVRRDGGQLVIEVPSATPAAA